MIPRSSEGWGSLISVLVEGEVEVEVEVEVQGFLDVI